MLVIVLYGVCEMNIKDKLKRLLKSHDDHNTDVIDTIVKTQAIRSKNAKLKKEVEDNGQII